MLKNRNMHNLNIADIQLIFKHMRDIYDFHVQLFSRELDERVKSWNSMPVICDLFVKYINIHRIYDQFSEDFETSFKALIDCITNSTQFSAYLKKRQDEVSVYLKLLFEFPHLKKINSNHTYLLYMRVDHTSILESN